ncbi:hypothetical protein B0H12DRAFT_1218305 [Mycena haematopus]|nr:hypothetical protein B0H12DRAFT_1218305 [Mycena haematopus]
MPSAFGFRLGTNYCPTDEEVLEIQSLLIEPTLRLKSLDDKIVDLRKSIDKLVEERVRLGSYVEAHEALISPVRRLPLDMIQEIFVACIPTHRNCVMSATEAPILLGHICSAWRTISLSTPQLWARLHVVEPQSRNLMGGASDAVYKRQVEQRLEKTKTWLGRSGQCPLSISLQGAVGHAPTTTVPFIEAFIPFAARWQHIHFAIPPSLIFEIMSYIDVEMPWLESVAFHSGQPPQFPSVARGSFEMLQGARISNFSVPGGLLTFEGLPLERFPLRWNQLTTLTIGGPEFSECTSEMVLPVISRCSELRSCKLLLNDRLETFGFEYPIIELRFLHTLAVRCSSSAAPTASVLLKRLSLPELRNFVLLGSFQFALGPDCPAFTDFLARAICLESFQMSPQPFSTPLFHKALRSLPPTVKELRIRGMPTSGSGPGQSIEDGTLKVLTTAGFCPALRHVTIDAGSSLSDAAVLQFITVRMLEFEPPTLERVEVQFRRAMTVDIMPSLQPFLDTGLSVSLDYSVPSFQDYSPWDGLADDPDKPLFQRVITDFCYRAEEVRDLPSEETRPIMAEGAAKAGNIERKG